MLIDLAMLRVLSICLKLTFEFDHQILDVTGSLNYMMCA